MAQKGAYVLGGNVDFCRALDDRVFDRPDFLLGLC